MTSSMEWLAGIQPNGLADAKIDFAVAVERAMDLVDKKRVDLAKDLSVTPSRITKVLSGDANLTIEMMHKIADALDHKIAINLVPKRLAGSPHVITSSNVSSSSARLIQSAQVLPFLKKAA